MVARNEVYPASGRRKVDVRLDYVLIVAMVALLFEEVVSNCHLARQYNAKDGTEHIAYLMPKMTLLEYL